MTLRTFAEQFAQEMRLKAVREHRDIDQLTVSKELGVSPGTVSRWKSGVVPDDNTMRRVASYFGVTPAWLRYCQEPREAPELPDAPLPKVATDPRTPAEKTRAKGKGGAKRRAGGGRR